MDSAYLLKVERACRAIRRAVAEVASGAETKLDKVTRATDAAYRAARFLDDATAAHDLITAARAGIEEAIDSGREARQAGYRVEISRLKVEHREAMWNSPTAWMWRRE